VRFVAVVLAGLAAGVPVATAGSPSIRASVDRATPRFGDPFTYVAEARFSREADRGDAAQVLADPGAFAVLAPPQTERATIGEDVVLTVTQRLACLSIACVPTGASRAVLLPRASVDLGGAVATAAPVVVSVGARVADAAVNAGEPQYRTATELPPPTTRFEPGPVVALLASAGILLAVVGIALAGYGALQGTARASRRRDLSPLTRALRLLRESSTRPPADRRRAAGLLARLLGTGGSDANLATEAQHVAWSRPDPSPRDAEVLADRTQRSLGGKP
jgi:hypothetical protein